MRTAWVTGASRGIGRAVARPLDGAGFRVFATARDAQALSDLAADLGEGTWAEPSDLTDELAVRRSFVALQTRWGTPDVLVNCAGVAEGAPLLEGTMTDWRTM